MPSEADHIACANRTQATIAHLLEYPDTHSPWIAVAAFYKALHIVEAIFANDRNVGDSSNQDEREAELKGQRRYEKIYEHYGKLKRASLNARYLSDVDCFDKYLSPADVIAKLLKHHLHQLEQSASKFITRPSVLVSVMTAFNDAKSSESEPPR